MKNILLLISLVLVWASCTQPEQNFLETENAYFGLTPPGLIPEVFAPNIVSDSTWAEHCQLAVSPNGKEIFWSAWTAAYKAEDGEKNTEQLFYSTYENNAWTKPKLAEFTKDNPHGLNGGPCFSPNGDKLFFYQVKSPWVSSNMNTYYVEKKNGKWGEEPMILDQSYNSEKRNYSPIFTKNGTAYKNRMGIISKYAFDDNSFTLIDSIIIYEGFRQAWNFYMSPNEEYVIFADLHDGGYGDTDLYISFKTEENNWGHPINLGPDINTEFRERFPIVSPDGKYLFFMRHTETQDFFWVSTEIIEDLKKQSEEI